MDLDSDANQSTGDPQNLGADYIVELVQARSCCLGGMGRTTHASDQGGLAYSWASGLTIRLNASGLNNTRRSPLTCWQSRVAFGSDVRSTARTAGATSRLRRSTPTRRMHRSRLRHPSGTRRTRMQATPIADSLRRNLDQARPSWREALLDDEASWRTASGRYCVLVEGQLAFGAEERVSSRKIKSTASGCRINRAGSPLSQAMLGRSGLMSDRQPNGQRRTGFRRASRTHPRSGYGVEAQAECYSVQLVYQFARELNFVPAKLSALCSWRFGSQTPPSLGRATETRALP